MHICSYVYSTARMLLHHRYKAVTADTDLSLQGLNILQLYCMVRNYFFLSALWSSYHKKGFQSTFQIQWHLHWKLCILSFWNWAFF
jgi:hypothetical protein